MFNSKKLKAVISFSVILIALCTFTILQGFGNAAKKVPVNLTVTGGIENANCSVVIRNNQNPNIRANMQSVGNGDYITYLDDGFDNNFYVTVCGQALQEKGVDPNMKLTVGSVYDKKVEIKIAPGLCAGNQ